MKFTGISDLLSELNQGLDKLNKGALSVNELEALTEVSREIYERLVVIRYKAYSGDASQEAEKTQEPAQNKPSATPSVQEPAVVLPPPAPAKTEEVKEEVSFGTEFKILAQSEESVSAPVVKAPEVVVQKVAPAPPVSNVSAGSSINEKLANEASSLAEKLGKSKIEDLRKAIGINQKFGLISDLFSGDADAYDLALDRFNSCTDMEEAASLYSEEKRARKWDDEDAQAAELFSLIQRRYL